MSKLAEKIIAAASPLVLLILWTNLGSAQSRADELGAELFFGSALSLPLPIRIDLGGEHTRFTARYATRPFAEAPYYSYRFYRPGAARSVELEMLHHKLYLQNPRPPVESFAISHGFNQPMVNVAMQPNGFQWRVGLGIVVAHPEGRIGGRNVGPMRTLIGGGYHIAGISGQAAVGRRYVLGHSATALTAAYEMKLTGAVARIRINGGNLWVPNLAVHGLGGLGIRRRR